MSLVKSKQRVADHGEVFTPAWMVEAMLDLVRDETERIDSRFLEPACGSGNFLVRILQRKLAAVELKYGQSDFERGHYALLALMSVYGIELLADTRALMENGADVFIRFNEGLSILKKVAAVENGAADCLTLSDDKRFDALVSSLRPFGFRTFFRGRKQKRKGDVTIYQNGGAGYVARNEVETGTELIDKWKIYIGRAAPGTGNRDTYPHRILSTPFIGEPGSICSETYLCIGPFETKAEAESALSYLTCRLTRLLILLHKPSQDTTRKVYTFVPVQTWDRKWTDKDLHAKYGISESEIEFIEKLVRPMDLSSDLLGDVTVDESDDE